VHSIPECEHSDPVCEDGQYFTKTNLRGRLDQAPYLMS